jgi:3-methyladenine DNA glycosylase/8-oxoguanine DNA glycosylase
MLKKMDVDEVAKNVTSDNLWIDAESFLSKDKHIGLLIKKYGHCKIRPSKRKDYFRDIAYSIIGQQLSMKVAEVIYNRLKDELRSRGQLISGRGGGVTPENILRKRDATLRKCGLSFAKIGYIKDLSERVTSNRLKVTSLEMLSDEDVIEELTQVKGIGRWTAEMFLMFSLARPDVFPVDDLGIRKGLQLMFNNRAYVRIIGNNGSRWKPYRTVASWYIWRNVDN